MINFTDRQIAITAMAASVLSTAIAVFTYLQSKSQLEMDYNAAVTISTGTLPIKTVPSDKAIEVDIVVTNTSKINLRYFMQAESNAACIRGELGRARIFPCMYESRIMTLSKPEAGGHSHKHRLTLQAPTNVDMPVLALSSDPIYYLSIDIVDGSNGRLLFRSKCFYTFESESKILALYEPVIDTTQRSKSIQSECGL